MNPWDKQKPGEQLPSGQCQADAGPGIHARVNASARVDSLHQAHGFFPIHLRKAGGNAAVVEIKQFDAAARVHAPYARYACATQITGSIVENSELSHSAPGVRQLRIYSNKVTARLTSWPLPTEVFRPCVFLPIK